MEPRGTTPSNALLPSGQRVATSAEPGALWGASTERRRPRTDFDVAAFQRMSPAQRHERLAVMKREHQQLGGEIQARVDRLDGLWGHSQLKTRTASLRSMQGQRPRLSAEQAGRLDVALASAEAARHDIESLSAEAHALGPASRKDPAQSARRSALAAQLRAARAREAAAVQAATDVVDEAGLKLERLATAEQHLDAGAPAEGSGDSLWDKLRSYFDLGRAIGAFTTALEVVDDMMGRVREQLTESSRIDREFEQRLRQQLERLDAEGHADAAAESSRRLLLSAR